MGQTQRTNRDTRRIIVEQSPFLSTDKVTDEWPSSFTCPAYEPDVLGRPHEIAQFVLLLSRFRHFHLGVPNARTFRISVVCRPIRKTGQTPAAFLADTVRRPLEHDIDPRIAMRLPV